MSLVDVRELVFDSPLRARSLLTVRAAISSARSSEAPCSRSLSLMCSYWRSRLLPFSHRGAAFHLPPISWRSFVVAHRIERTRCASTRTPALEIVGAA
jgi:hypothetical protein